MNIIESLVIMLSLDSSKMKTGLHEAREDLTKTGKHAEETAKHVEEQGERAAKFFEKLKEHALEFFGVMASVGELISFTEHTIKSGTAMLHLSEETHMSVEEISLWQNAVTIAGGSAEGFNQSLKGMAEKLVAIETNMPRAKAAMRAFKEAGLGDIVAIGKHTELTTVYEAAHEKFQHMELAKAMTMGKRMQLDEHTIRLLHTSGEAYDEFMAKAKEAGVLTKEQAEASEKAEEGMNEFKISMQRAMEQVVVLALPAIKAMSGALTKVAHWAHENRDTVVTALLGIGAAALVMGANALVAGAQMALAWLIGLGPITLIAAAIGAVVTVGAILYNKFEGFRSVMQAIWGAAKDVFGGIMDLIEAVGDFFSGDTDKMSEAWNNFCLKMDQAGIKLEASIILLFLTIGDFIIQAFAKAWEAVKASSMEFFNWIESKLMKLGSKIAEMFGGLTMKDLEEAANKPITQQKHPQHLPQAPTRTMVPAPAPSGFPPPHAASTGPVGASPQAPTSAPPEKPKVTVTDTQFWDAYNARHKPSAQQSVINAALGRGSTSTTSSQMHVDTINVNAPNATDAAGVAGGITQAMAEKHKDLVNQADGGLS